MLNQEVLAADKNYEGLDRYFQAQGIRSVFLVCGRSLSSLRLGKYFEELPSRLGIRVVRFSDFQPNPQYESVVSGVEKFRESGCEMIAAVGGGSAMDVAKCVKLFAGMDDSENYLRQEIRPNDIPFLAVPTTAGTGSEATRFAVIYYQGDKQSVTHKSCIPSAVLMDPSVLDTLPEYQRKATLLDALCHAVESFWSVHSTLESQEYSRAAIRMILENMDGYLKNMPDGSASSMPCGVGRSLLQAANLAGRAINIAQTTAGHAMCYKLTSLFGLAHGHAAALCVAALWPHMLRHTADCIDPRGREYLETELKELAAAFGCEKPMDAANLFREILRKLGLKPPAAKEEDIEFLKRSVNQDRLKNHPVRLTEAAIEALYREILDEGMRNQCG